HAHTASGSLKQVNSQAVLNALHLARDGALSQAGNLGGLGKAAMFHDEVEKRQFIQIERNSAEEAMHNAHQCMRLMNFTQEWECRRFVSKAKGKTMANRNERLPQNIAGAYYVDSSCVDCDVRRSTAPDFFHRDDE